MYNNNPFDLHAESKRDSFAEAARNSPDSITWMHLMAAAIEGTVEPFSLEIMRAEMQLVNSKVDKPYFWRALMGNLESDTLYSLARSRATTNEPVSDARALIPLAMILYGLVHKQTTDYVINNSVTTTQEASKFMGAAWVACLVELERRNRAITTLVIQDEPFNEEGIFVMYTRSYTAYLTSLDSSEVYIGDTLKSIYCTGPNYPVFPEGYKELPPAPRD